MAASLLRIRKEAQKLCGRSRNIRREKDMRDALKIVRKLKERYRI